MNERLRDGVRRAVVWARSRPDGLAVAAGGVLGAIYYLWTYRPVTLLPTYIDWLMSHDRAQHFLGWHFFRRGPWDWPLGRIDALGAPNGTTVGYTDSIPWLALPGKLLTGFIDAPLQYSGPYVFGCFVLLGVLGVLLARRFTPSPLLQLFVAVFIITTPMVLRRVFHVALAAHFLLLIALWLYWTPPAPGREARRTAGWAGLAAAAAGIHPYLTAMVLALSVPAFVRAVWPDRRLRPQAAALHAAAPFVAALATFAIFGYLKGGSEMADSGFGAWSANLLAFVNPMGFGSLLQTWAMPRTQVEGFAYLGAGLILVVVAAAVLLIARRPSDLRQPLIQSAPLVVVVLLMACYAFASPVYLGKTPLFRLDGFYALLQPLPAIFRSSGRFIWPLYYVLVLAALAVVARSLPVRAAAVLLGVAFVVQMIDLRPLLGQDRRRSQHIAWQRLHAPPWQQIGQEHDAIILVPSSNAGTHRCMPPAFRFDDVTMFSFLAAEQGMTINALFDARIPRERLAEQCRQLRDGLARGSLDPTAAYVVHPAYAGAFRWWAGDAASCRRLDGFYLCTSGPQQEAIDEPVVVELRFDKNARSPPVLETAEGLRKTHAGRRRIEPGGARLRLRGELHGGVDVILHRVEPRGDRPTRVRVGEQDELVTWERGIGTASFAGLGGERTIEISATDASGKPIGLVLGGLDLRMRPAPAH